MYYLKIIFLFDKININFLKKKILKKLINSVINNNKFEEWNTKLGEIYHEFFESDNNKLVSTIGASLRDLQKDNLLESLEKNTQQAIQEELIR